MASRLQLQSKLEELLGTKNVYYNSPSSMNYPAIIYSKKKIDTRYANNHIYTKMNCYEVIVIDYEPDNEVNDKILELPYCTFDRSYKADNLNHDVYTLYY